MQLKLNDGRSSRRWLNKWGLILAFALAGVLIVPMTSTATALRKNDEKIPLPSLKTKMSLIHVGSNDSFNPTSEGIKAGRLLLDALKRRDLKQARKAIAIYDSIIPRENYGGEYTALQWFACYLVASQDERAAFLSDPFVANFFHFFADSDFATLKEYLIRKYNLEQIEDKETRTGQDRLALLEDTILFNNPRREEWEQTTQFMKALKLKKGAIVADIGSGPGYFTYRFSHLVGHQGRVYAIDTVRKHLEYVDRFRAKFGMQNITTVHSDGKTIGLAGKKVDAVFLCSLYHNIYGMATLKMREQFIESIKDTLKDDGLLYLVDNGLVEPGTLPYHGPYVAKELIIAQLNQYGFDLVDQYQPIAQRYMLVFQLKKENAVVGQVTDKTGIHP